MGSCVSNIDELPPLEAAPWLPLVIAEELGLVKKDLMPEFETSINALGIGVRAALSHRRTCVTDLQCLLNNSMQYRVVLPVRMQRCSPARGLGQTEHPTLKIEYPLTPAGSGMRVAIGISSLNMFSHL